MPHRLGRGTFEAAEKAERIGASARVRQALTKAIGAATTNSTGVSTFGSLITAFLEQVRAVGVFDQVAARALNLPLKPGNILIDTSSIVASTAAEGAAKPLSAVYLNAEAFQPTKVLAQIVLTKELIDGLGDAGIRTLGRELVRAVAVGSDSAFLNAIAASNSFEASGGSTIADILDQFEELLHNVRLGVGSAPFFVMGQATAKALSAKLTARASPPSAPRAARSWAWTFWSVTAKPPTA